MSRRFHRIIFRRRRAELQQQANEAQVRQMRQLFEMLAGQRREPGCDSQLEDDDLPHHCGKGEDHNGEHQCTCGISWGAPSEQAN